MREELLGVVTMPVADPGGNGGKTVLVGMFELAIWFTFERGFSHLMSTPNLQKVFVPWKDSTLLSSTLEADTCCLER